MARTYLKSRKKNNRKFLFTFIALFVLAICLVGHINRSIKANKRKLDGEISAKREEITTINKDIDELDRDYEMRNTDEFKEKIARERLNMIKDDEYVYKDENAK